MKTVIKVRIVKAENPTYWYASLVGRVFEVYYFSGDYVIKEDYDRGHDAPWGHLAMDDCVVIE